MNLQGKYNAVVNKDVEVRNTMNEMKKNSKSFSNEYLKKD